MPHDLHHHDAFDASFGHARERVSYKALGVAVALTLAHFTTVLVERPISLGLLIVSAILLAMIVLPQFRRTREAAFQE